MVFREIKKKPNKAKQPSGISAATRVFGIPELLEHILICRADADVEEYENGLPVTCLFVWQRVNCTFLNTIQTSPELRQLMLLDCPENAEAWEDREYLNLFALRMLFGNDEGRSVWKTLSYALPLGDYSLPLIEFRSPFPECRQVFKNQERLLARLTQPDASWRKIKLHAPAEEGVRRVWQMVREHGTCSGYLVELLIEEDLTLGDFADTVCDLLKRCKDQHTDRCMGFGPFRLFDSWTLVHMLRIGEAIQKTETVRVKRSAT